MRVYFDITFEGLDGEAFTEGVCNVDAICFNDGDLRLTCEEDDCSVEETGLSGRYREPITIIQWDDEEGDETESCSADYSEEELQKLFAEAKLTGLAIYADEICEPLLQEAKFAEASVKLVIGDGQELQFTETSVDLEINW